MTGDAAEDEAAGAESTRNDFAADEGTGRSGAWAALPTQHEETSRSLASSVQHGMPADVQTQHAASAGAASVSSNTAMSGVLNVRNPVIPGPIEQVGCRAQTRVFSAKSRGSFRGLRDFPQLYWEKSGTSAARATSH